MRRINKMLKLQETLSEEQTTRIQNFLYYPAMITLVVQKLMLAGISFRSEPQELWKLLICLLIIPSNILLFKLKFLIPRVNVSLSLHLFIALTGSFLIDAEFLLKMESDRLLNMGFWILFETYLLWIVKLKLPILLTLTFQILSSCFIIFKKLYFLPTSQEITLSVLILILNQLVFCSLLFFERNSESESVKSKAKDELNIAQLMKLTTKLNQKGFLVFDKTDIFYKKESNFELFSEKLTKTQEIAHYLSCYSIINNTNKSKENDTLKSENDFLVFEMDEVTTHDRYETIIKSFFDRSYTDQPLELMGFKKSQTPDNNPEVIELTLGKFFWKGKDALYLSIKDRKSDGSVNNQCSCYHRSFDIASILCHNIKNPVNGLLGLIQTLEYKDQGLNLAINQICVLSYTLDQILDFFAIVDGNMKLNFQKIMLIRFNKELDLIRKIFSQHENLEIIYNENISESSKYLLLDYNKLKQILISLLSVSIKLTQKKGLIKCDINKLKNGDNEYFRFRITLKNLEFTKEQIENIASLNIFNKEENDDFSMLDLKFSLWISQKLLQLLNENKNEMEISYIDDQLMTIIFILPLRSNISTDFSFTSEKIHDGFSTLNIPAMKSFTATGTHTRLSIFSKRKQEEKPMILIVDDDEINILIESNYLKSFGKYDFLIARNGQEAVDLILSCAQKGQKIDVILMDCNMPVKDGLQASKEINTLAGEQKLLKRPDIIAVTANTTKYDSELCKKAGMDHFLAKPINIGDLEVMLNNICKKI